MRLSISRSALCVGLLVASTATVTATVSSAAAGPDASARRAGSVSRAMLAPFTASQTNTEGTIGYDNTRTNWDSHEPALAPTSVQASDFGQIFSRKLAGVTSKSPNQIYAQPLVVHNTVIVATEDNRVAGLDAISGKIKWERSLGTPWTPSGCGDLVPHIGVTSTPVYDPKTNRVYLVAKIASGAHGAIYKLFALSPTTGAERAGWPVTIRGRSINGGQTFNPTTANQRPGLLLMNGAIYMGFASHCDHGPYVGYVIGATIGSRNLHLWSTESRLANDKAGIWQSGGGLVSDGVGRIFLATGNGVAPASGARTPPGTLGESVVRLGVDRHGNISAKDFYSPANNAKLNQDDSDLGSGGPIALPRSFGTSKYPHLLMQAGKDGVVRLLNRARLGGTGAAMLSHVQEKGLWGRFAAFSHGNDHYVFALPTGSPMVMFRVRANNSNVPTLSVAATTEDKFHYTSGSPVITSNGTSENSVVIWVVTVDSKQGSNAYLRAYRLPPARGAWKPVQSFKLGTVAKFVQPATALGHVYVGTRDGRVLSFGRPVKSAVHAHSTDFGMQAVDSTSKKKSVTITARQPVTVESYSTSKPFAVTKLAKPVKLTAGKSSKASVTFHPTGTGAVDGTLVVNVKFGAIKSHYDFDLHGTGTKPGLSADPSPLAFGEVNDGSSSDLSMTVTNTGSKTTTITDVSALDAPYSYTDHPAVGKTIKAQSSINVTVRFSPQSASTDPTPYNQDVTITSDTGAVTVPLTGTGFVANPAYTLSSQDLNFGHVSPGHRRTLSFTLVNTGNTDLTISKAPPPNLPFSAPQIEGQTVPVDDKITVHVVYKPSSAGSATDHYSISIPGTSGNPRLVMLHGNAGAWSGQISTPLGCLQVHGGTAANGTPVESGVCGKSAGQRFSVDAKTGTIHAGSSTSTSCLNVASTARRTAVGVATCDGSAGQVWTWRSDDSMYNPRSAKCLDVRSASRAAGTAVQIYTCNKTDAQYWNLAGLQSARGAMSSGVGAVNDYCADVRAASAANGTAVQLYTCNSTRAQVVTHVGNQLRALGQCYDVRAAGTANGTRVQLYRCNGTRAQQWTRGEHGRFVNAGSGKCLDDPSRSTNNGTQLQIYTCNGTSAQRWNFPK